MEARPAYACPDLGPGAGDGRPLPIPGSEYEFHECPAYYLRTAGMDMPADHLIDGHLHPARLASEQAAELEAGAIRADDLSPRMRTLVHLWRVEHAAARDHERDEDRRNREMGREARRGG